MRKVPWSERLWAKIDKSGGPEACWPCKASTNGKAHTKLWAEGRLQYAHRLAYKDLVGPIPEGLDILHNCDNPPCCNPAHLRPGTNDDNVADMVARGRTTHGERSAAAKLTATQVLEIRARRALNERVVDLAKAFGVSSPTISTICKRHTWRHI